MDCIYRALFRPVATQRALQLLPHIHPFIHRRSQLTGGVGCLAQGHLDT